MTTKAPAYLGYQAFTALLKSAKTLRISLCVLGLAVLAPALPAQTVSTSPLAISLATLTPVVAEDGKETLAPVGEAEPGQVLVYQATYQNTGDKALGNVAATVPVPASFEYIDGSAQPAATEASLDGKTFFPVGQPPEGSKTSAWRALRWSPRSLAAGKSFTVELRARVGAR